MSIEHSSDISFSTSHSRLLSETFASAAFSSQSSLGGDDLSVSELSLVGQPHEMDKPFSLLATPSLPTPTRSSHEDFAEDGNNGADSERAERHTYAAQQAREERLRIDISILRKINTSFALLNDALREAESANERIAAQLEQTDTLLNRYINILSKSEEITRLILDEDWHGAEHDEESLERERVLQKEAARREAEECLLAARLEEERRQREAQELLEREERRRVEGLREAKEKGHALATARYSRGTVSATRGIRGAPHGGNNSQRRPLVSTAQASHNRASSKTPSSRSVVRGP